MPHVFERIEGKSVLPAASAAESEVVVFATIFLWLFVGQSQFACAHSLACCQDTAVSGHSVWLVSRSCSITIVRKLLFVCKCVSI